MTEAKADNKIHKSCNEKWSWQTSSSHNTKFQLIQL